MRPEDVEWVTALAAAEPVAPHWPPFEYHRMLRIAAEQPSRRGAWVAVSGETDADVCGFAIASAAAGEAELESVVVAEAFRRRGVGRGLLAEVMRWGRDIGAERLLLEVRASNEAARAMYVRAGFQEDGVRRRYYRNPEEDAVLLSLPLGQPSR